MPRESVRTRRRTFGCLSFAISALALIAVVLVCAIVIANRVKLPVKGPAVTEAPEDSYVDVNDLPETRMVLTADTFTGDQLLTANDSPSPTPEETPEPTPVPTLEPDGSTNQLRPVSEDPDMLPIYRKANTDQKVIAVTLDECAGAQITGKFITMANSFGAKLTLFPTGENIMKAGMGTLMKQCVFNYGFEIENRGFSELGRVYQYIDTLMVKEIWSQSVALNFVLGVKYQPHFYRMYGGLGEGDRRTHAYLKQEGYIGIAHWTVSCSDVEPQMLANKLTPGGIYSFRSTEEDGNRMFIFMQAARDAGYRMVTLNELFGLPANTYQQVQGSLLAETMPEFHYDASEYYDLYPGDAAWAVALLQERLTDLGYLPEESSDGIFGNATANALRLFQAEAGRAASGAADVETQKLLFADDAPENPKPLAEAQDDFSSLEARDDARMKDETPLLPEGIAGEPVGEEEPGETEAQDPGNPFDEPEDVEEETFEE